MTINPKVKIASGVVLAAAGAYEIKNAIKATEKKKKIIHGIAGVALILSGLFIGKKGVVQVMGLSVQNRKIDDTDNPAQAIASDLNAQSADKKKAAQAQNFSGKKKDTVIVKDSFSQILNSSAGGGSGQVMEKSQAKQTPPNNVVVKHQDRRTGGTGVNSPNKISPVEIEKSRLRKKAITDSISLKEEEHKKIAKDKNRGWNDDNARKLRNDISLLKAQLFYV